MENENNKQIYKSIQSPWWYIILWYFDDSWNFPVAGSQF